MSKDRIRGVAIAAILLWAILPGASQAPALRILSATPSGDLATLADADQIRIVFSEPMVALGSVLSGSAPPWIRITPAVAGSFFWSGTKTLIFSPDGSAPLPYATRFTVHVGTSAASPAGHALDAPYELTFTTPTVRLISADWYRQTGRFDSPALIALLFNQPVRAEDVVAHTRVALVPHAWKAPVLAAGARERWRQTDPAGLVRFDEKVASVRRVTATSEAVGVRVARSWNQLRFRPAPTRVVLETTTAPPPDGRLSIAIDGTMPSLGGPATRPAHSTPVQLEATFFMAGTGCTVWCDPGVSNAIQLTRPVALAALRRALTVADVTDGARDRPVFPARDIPPESVAQESAHAPLSALGFRPQPPGRTWQLQVDAALTAADGQPLGYSWVGLVETVYSQAFLAFDGMVWEAGAGTLLPLHARNVSSVTQWIAPASLLSVMPRLRALRTDSPSLPPGASETRLLNPTPDAVQVHGLDIGRWLSRAGTGLLSAAVAPAEVLARSVPPSGNPSRSTLVQVTNLGIAVKDSPLSTLVFVTGLDSGLPVADARVAIVDTANRTRWRGTTDRDGVALSPGLALRRSAGRDDLAFVVTVEKDGDVAFVGSDWNNGLSPWAWNIAYDPTESAPVLRGSVFTDRGVYKEAEEVHLKAVVRDDTPNGVRLVAPGAALEVVVRDSRDREVDRRRVVVSSWSSAEWTWRVPAGAALGDYEVQMSRAAAARPGRPDRSRTEAEPDVVGTFLVAAFRRPDFRVEATLTGDPPEMGSTLRATVEAKYLFGGALGARPISWWFRRHAVQEPPPAILEKYPGARYAIGYLPGYGDDPDQGPQLPEMTGVLGGDGRTLVELPTSSDRAIAYSYMFEGDVEDVSGQHIANRAALVVHPASLYVAVSRPPMFVDAKSGTAVRVLAVDLAGRPVVDVPVTVSLVREQWVAGPPPGPWTQIGWQRREIPAGEWTVRTSAAETPVPIPSLDGGRYILRATARDANGRPARTEIGFYALGPGAASWRSDGNRIDLTPERETWKPGETARILIHSPWPRATALVTVEREDIRSHRSFTVTSTQDTVEVPITEADVPNVYVSVMLVKGRTSTELAADGSDPGQPSFRVGYTQLSVDDSSKRLRVDVAADRDVYGPRQPVTVSVAVAARDGRPAASEVTLWAIDYGLLSLTDYKTPDVLKAIYVPKALQVMTGDNRQRLMSRRPMAAPVERMFGDMGTLQTSQAAVSPPSALAPLPPPPGAMIRQDFRPLVFWLGSAITGADGRATTTVTLPDSLTTYRIMAVAGDKVSQFGFGEREIRVTKPLTLLPAFPRFLSKGDRASFGAVVTNSGKEAGSAVVTIESLDPGTLQFGNVTPQTVRLAPGASASVTFDALARGAGTPRVRMHVTLGAETDAFEAPLLVSEPLRPETTAAYGDTTSTAIEGLALPPGVLPGAGGLTVDLSSTALVGLGEAARYLDEYPYECAEQKASRALGLLLASDLNGAFTLSGRKPAQYRAEAIAALPALSAFQCDSGGFSLWPGQCRAESIYLTAYILHVMKVAGTLQVPVNAALVEPALDYLQAAVKDAPPEIDWWPVWSASQAYSVKVLAEFGRKPTAQIDRLAGLAERLPVFALSYLADALAASNDRGPRYQDVIRRLTNAIRIDADRAHVEEIDDDALAWVWSSNVRTTAVVLDGFSRRRDDPALVAPLVRWLVAARRNGRWDTTHENAMALEALVAYYRAFESGVPRMTTTVTVGSATVGTASFNGRSTTSRQVRMPMDDLLKQVTTPSTLSISRTGTGRVYYTARLQTYAPEPPEAVDRGFQVERRYERYVKGETGPEASSFSSGDLVRIRVTLTVRGEGRYIALTDPVPAGFEPIEGWFQTTASDIAHETRIDPDADWLTQWRKGTFDYIEKHDDRVQAFATRLASGRHELTYLARATTAGTFHAGGARVEAMYAPELTGRSHAATVTVK